MQGQSKWNLDAASDPGMRATPPNDFVLAAIRQVIRQLRVGLNQSGEEAHWPAHARLLPVHHARWPRVRRATDTEWLRQFDLHGCNATLSPGLAGRRKQQRP